MWIIQILIWCILLLNVRIVLLKGKLVVVLMSALLSMAVNVMFDFLPRFCLLLRFFSPFFCHLVMIVCALVHLVNDILLGYLIYFVLIFLIILLILLDILVDEYASSLLL